MQRLPWRSVLACLVVCGVVLFWRLGFLGLMDDEAHYAQITREMAAAGEWIVPLLGGAPFLDKPVLFQWLQGLAFAVAGPSETAARLPSALAAVALFAVTFWLGRRVEDRTVGVGAWLMLATIPATFFLGRFGYLDMLFTAFLFGGVACLVAAAAGSPRWLQFPGFALLTLAVLTKGPTALVLLATFLGAAWLIGGPVRRAVNGLDWKRGLVAAGLAAAPWFLLVYWQYSEAFVESYVVTGHTDYFTPRGSASSSESTFYLRMFFTAFFPWSLVAAGYGIDTWRRRMRGVRPPVWETLLWIWIGVVLALFTVVPFRVDRYIYPAAPACCLLAMQGWRAARGASTVREFVATRITVFTTALVLVAAGSALAVALPRVGLDLPTAAYLLPVTLALGGAAIAVSMVRARLAPPRLAGWPVTTLVAAYGLVVLFGLPLVKAGLPMDAVGRYVAAQSAAGDPVGLLGLDRWEMSLRYYVPGPVRRLGGDTEAWSFAAQPGPRWLITRRDRYDTLAASGCLGDLVSSVPAIVGTTGRGIRAQVWSEIVVVQIPVRVSARTEETIATPAERAGQALCEDRASLQVRAGR